MMWCIAIYVHVLVAVIMAVVYVHFPTDDVPFVLTMTISAEAEELVDDPVAEIVVPEEDPQEDTPIPTVELPALEDFLPDTEHVQELLTAAVGRLRQASEENRKPARAAKTKPSPPPVSPAPVHAVTAGSFSVWTEPANPVPDEPYRIVVLIRMPDERKQYNLRDLQGVVIGSDGYRKPIPGYRHDNLPVINGYVRYEIPIVSAERLVEDVVFVRSRMLREAQRLHVRF